MKRFVLRLTFFLLVASTCYVALLLAAFNYLPVRVKRNMNFENPRLTLTHKRLEEAKKYSNIDVLFLGSSHAYRSFDTRIFEKAGVSSFNLGTSAQTPVQTEMLLRRYLDKLKPKVVFYEVYPATFTIDGVESSVSLIYNDFIDSETLRMVLQQKSIKLFNTLIIGRHLELTSVKSGIGKIQNDHDMYVPGGYVERKKNFYRYDTLAQTNSWKFLDMQFAAFERCLSLLNSKGVVCMLVQAPITKSLYNSYLNNEAFDHKMEGYGDYLNFNDYLELDDSLHFSDSHHLNQDGAEILTARILDIYLNYPFTESQGK